MLGAVALVLLTVGLAFANGANDVSKGIATLVGSGIASDRRALAWGAAWTSAGLPVSTTHALVGGLVGAGLMAEGPAGVKWATVAQKVALPLAVSPLLSLTLVFVILPAVTLLFRRLNRYCVCLERRELALTPAVPGPAIAAGHALHVIAGADCPPQVLTRVNALDSV